MAAMELEYGNDKDGLRQELNAKLGPLYQAKWYRIILDEAHQIKNMGALSRFTSPLATRLESAPQLTSRSYSSLLLLEL